MLKVPITICVWLLAGGISVTWGQEKGGVKVTLDKTVVYIWCPVSRRPDAECPIGGEKVHVHVASDSESDISVRYQSSGGRIVGAGQDVVWDLANFAPGTYKIKVKAKLGGRTLPTVVKTIELAECPECDLGCTCPTIVVSPSAPQIGAGGVMTFAANVSGLVKGQLTYKWNIENGHIIKGRKGNLVTVKASKTGAGKKLIATVDIGGTDVDCGCVTSVAETVEIR